MREREKKRRNFLFAKFDILKAKFAEFSFDMKKKKGMQKKVISSI